VENETLDQAYQAGQLAFERGDYRQAVQWLEQAAGLAESGTKLEGEVQMWLVNAYEAGGMREQALDLCRQISRHPDWQSRQQAKRLLYILEAPRLRLKPEWQSEIPDLTQLESADGWGNVGASNRTAPPPRLEEKTYTIAPPTDPTQVKTQDRQALWVALVGIVLTLGGLLWLSAIS
jgi:tetratricopeptide (TPR) repeat protein